MANDETVRKVAEAIVGAYFRQGHFDQSDVTDDDIEAARRAIIALQNTSTNNDHGLNQPNLSAGPTTQ